MDERLAPGSMFTMTAEGIAVYVPPKYLSVGRLQEVCEWLKSKGGRKITDATYFFGLVSPPSVVEFQNKFSPLRLEEGYVWFDGKGSKPQIHVITGDTIATDAKIVLASS